jgi:hypothetical protein
MSTAYARFGVASVEGASMLSRSAASRKQPKVGSPAADQQKVVLGLADWLCLAAAPTFGIMALLTAILGDGMPDMICSGMHGSSPFAGMVPMYLLMSAFHSAPWLRLIANQRNGGS